MALQRALLTKERLILLDEPFSNIDFKSRPTLINHLREWVNNNNLTIFCSIHSLDEVLLFADNIFVSYGVPTEKLTNYHISSNIRTSRTITLLKEKSFLDIRSKILEELE